MKAGVLTFPGSNCDRDLGTVLEREYSFSVDYLWHTESFADEYDAYFIPGGFSYGDYLRSGAMAARSLSLQSLKKASEAGKLVIGICNGFQILTEARLLPGALIRNNSLRHVCDWTKLSGVGEWSEIPEDYALPVSHSEGNYRIDEEGLKSLEDSGQVILRYQKNPNGSLNDIAGIQSTDGRVIGLMPHPERAIYPSLDYRQSSAIPGKIFFDIAFRRL